MTTVLWLAAGLVLGGLFLVFARTQGPAELRVLALGLVVAALIYAGFALANGRLRWVLVELGGTGLCGALAWLGLRRSSR